MNNINCIITGNSQILGKRDFYNFEDPLWKERAIEAISQSSNYHAKYAIIEAIKREGEGPNHLRLNDCQLAQLPLEIFALNSLVSLDVDNNNLKKLPDTIGNLSRLKVLTANGNKLVNIPYEINKLASLEQLELQSNGISVFTYNLHSLTCLTKLYLNSNYLDCLPIEIGCLTNLTILKLENNRLTSLPSEIGKLVRLQALSVDNNRLTSLPSEIGCLANLSSLTLHCNGLASLPSEIGYCTRLNTFSVHQNKLSSLPATIGNLTDLNSLTLYSNDLASLPSEIGNCTKLSTFSVYQNKLSSLPATIGKLTNIDAFDASKNALNSLPSEIGKLVLLTSLDLSNNLLPSLPFEIGELTRVTSLMLYNNKLTSLPPVIGRLVNLSLLNVSHNKLRFLPLEIGLCKRISTLSIKANPDLGILPMSLGQIPGLTFVDTENTKIPPAILNPILAQCRLMRERMAHQFLFLRLNTWKALANSEVDLEKIMQLTDKQKITINEWLVRLESTSDFSNSQKELTVIVCALLESLYAHDNFKELFFVQIGANLECCEDRSAMALNEIYTSWLLLCKISSRHDKLKKLTGVAKTLRLRKVLQMKIQKHESERKKENHAYRGELESVEIFLYYESTLKNELQLESAIQNMTYSPVGDRSWINNDDLIKDVQENYFEELVQIPIFAEMMNDKWDQITKEYHAKLDNLGERPAGSDLDAAVLEYQTQQGKILNEWKAKKIEAAKEFILRN